MTELLSRINQQTIVNDSTMPHVLMRPKIYQDGGNWCALYGDNLMEGVAGFGKSPEKACADFDANWYKET